MLREKSKWKHHKDLSTNVVYRGGLTRISDEGVERHWSEGVELSVLFVNQLPKVGGIKLSKTKSFCISKKSVMAAWERVKENKGTYGVDLESLEDFEENLKDNLYKLWNRMSSGSYFPLAVRGMEIPKRDGGKTNRLLSIPTVSDRVAQALLHESDFGHNAPFPKSWGYAMRTEIGLPISNILFKSWHLIVISFFILSSLLDRNLLPKEFLNLKKAFSANSLRPYLFLLLHA